MPSQTKVPDAPVMDEIMEVPFQAFGAAGSPSPATTLIAAPSMSVGKRISSPPHSVKVWFAPSRAAATVGQT